MNSLFEFTCRTNSKEVMELLDTELSKVKSLLKFAVGNVEPFTNSVSAIVEEMSLVEFAFMETPDPMMENPRPTRAEVSDVN